MSLERVIFFFGVLVNVCVCRSAEWQIYRHKGDELEGTRPYVSYSYGNETGCVVLYDDSPAIKFSHEFALAERAVF